MRSIGHDWPVIAAPEVIRHAARIDILASRPDFAASADAPPLGCPVVAGGGNTVFITDDKGTVDDTEDDTTIARPLGACSGGGYTGALLNPEGQPGSGCGFAWADIAWIDDHERYGQYGLFANFDYPLGNGATVYAGARFAQGREEDRYAPSVGKLDFDFSDSPSQELQNSGSRRISPP